MECWERLGAQQRLRIEEVAATASTVNDTIQGLRAEARKCFAPDGDVEAFLAQRGLPLIRYTMHAPVVQLFMLAALAGSCGGAAEPTCAKASAEASAAIDSLADPRKQRIRWNKSGKKKGMSLEEWGQQEAAAQQLLTTLLSDLRRLAGGRGAAGEARAATAAAGVAATNLQAPGHAAGEENAASVGATPARLVSGSADGAAAAAAASDGSGVESGGSLKATATASGDDTPLGAGRSSPWAAGVGDRALAAAMLKMREGAENHEDPDVRAAWTLAAASGAVQLVSQPATTALASAWLRVAALRRHCGGTAARRSSGGAAATGLLAGAGRAT
jgi:hypothetical protein